MSALSFARDLLRRARATADRQPGRIWMIGPMPDPVNGQTQYNRRMAAEIEARAPVTVLPSGGTGPQKLAAALVLPLIVLLRLRRGDQVYLSPPGQNGLWLFLGVLAALRLRRMDHFLHHHSYRPINLGPTRAARAMVATSGPYQRHVFLSDGMRDAFSRLYLDPAQTRRSLVLPNSYLFFEPPTELPERNGPITVGHLSVITREKGVGHLLAILRPVLQRRGDVSFLLAGPVRDEALAREIDEFCAAFPGRAVYRGPVYGEAKAEFYREVDLFVLPSRLVDEADPLVILEGYSAGCDVLATATGCIPERLRSPDHLLRFASDADVRTLEAAVDRIAADRAGVATASQRHVEALHDRSVAQAARFFAEIGIPIASGDAVTGGAPTAPRVTTSRKQPVPTS